MWRKYNWDEVARRYVESGETLLAIAQALKISKPTLRRKLKARGVDTSRNFKKRNGTNGKWSRKRDACLDCGESRTRYGGRDLCHNCYTAWGYRIRFFPSRGIRTRRNKRTQSYAEWDWDDVKEYLVIKSEREKGD